LTPGYSPARIDQANVLFQKSGSPGGFALPETARRRRLLVILLLISQKDLSEKQERAGKQKEEKRDYDYEWE